MGIMDFVTGVGLITGILSVPSSIYVFFQIHQNRQKPLVDAKVAQQNYINVLEHLSELRDRVLIAFDRDNAEKEGTFEHLVFSFWNEFSKYNRTGMFFVRVEDFVYNPLGVIHNTRVRLS